MSRYSKPNNAVTNRIAFRLVGPVERYLRAFHRNSWWQIDKDEIDNSGLVRFRSSPQLFNIVFAFMEGYIAKEKEFKLEL